MNLTPSCPFASGLRRALISVSASILFILPALEVFADAEALSVEVRGNGPAVLLIPGLGSSGSVWKTTVDALAANHTCHVVTLAGFAGQPAVQGPFLDSAETALKTYLATHHLEKPVIIGHSLGGLLTLRLAAHLHPAPSAAIVVDSLPFYSGIQPGATPETARQFAEMMRAQMEKQSRKAFLEASQQSAALLVTSDEDRKRVASWMAESDQGAVARAMAEVLAFDGRPLVSEITCPVLLVEAGQTPGAVPEELYQSQYAALKGMKRIRFPDARHFVMLDQPTRFLQEILTFLQTDAR